MTCRPFLIGHLLRHPTVVTVPVAPVELVDGVGIGVVAVDGIRTDLLFFAGASGVHSIPLKLAL